MGLKYPSDLEAWSNWQANAHLLRRSKNTVKSFASTLRQSGANLVQDKPVSGYLHTRGEDAKLLFVLDSTSPTSLNSLIAPTAFLGETPYAVWAPSDVSSYLSQVFPWEAQTVIENQLDSFLPEIQQVVALGHYMEWGAAAYRLSQRLGARFVTVQHGLNTPYAPPLAPGTHLLAFSQDDADFWISGRTDVTAQVVGSQLFWEAAQQPAVDSAEIPSTPLFLGQMHGAELPRASFAHSTLKFLRENKAIYRPHPSEKDKLSLLTHGLMDRLGIEVDRSQRPLNQVNHPVVSIFSTGVLEAALRGVPSWVYHTNPPAWLREFWDRYGMSFWGSEPTQAPQLPSREPAESIALILTRSLEN